MTNIFNLIFVTSIKFFKFNFMFIKEKSLNHDQIAQA